MYPVITDESAREAVNYLALVDPLLAPAIAKVGVCPIRPHSNYYRELVEAIIGQQLSVKAAAAIQKRFNGLFDAAPGRRLHATPSEPDHNKEDLFPTPPQLVAASIDDLRTAGLSRAKGAYVQDLAQRIIDGRLAFDRFDQLTNDAIRLELTAVKGIGIWTADMFLLFCMARSDILPTGDLGIRSSIQKLYGLTTLPDKAQIEAIARKNQWQPHISIATWYLWQNLDNAPSTTAI